MSLYFGNTGSDGVTVSDSSELQSLTTATYIAWVNFSLSNMVSNIQYRIMMKGKFGTGYHLLNFQDISDTDYVAMSVERTSDLVARAATANFANYGDNKWLYVAGVHNTGGADGDQKLWVGDLSNPADEPSSYDTQTVGSGTPVSNVGQDQWIGNHASVTNRPFSGDIAKVYIYNVVLTEAQIIAQQFQAVPILPGNCVLYIELGLTADASSTQPDWSGNGNNGSPNATPSLSPHVPLPIFPFQTWSPYEVTAAADLNVAITNTSAYQYTGVRIITP